MPKKGKRSLKRALIPIIIIAAVLGLALLFISKENLSGMINSLSGADYRLVLFAVGIYFFGLSMWGLRWKTAILAGGKNVDMRLIYLSILGSVFINNVTPFTYSGGDPIARTYILKKTRGVRYVTGFATVASEFLVDFPIFFTLLIWGLFLWKFQILGLILIAFWLVIMCAFISIFYYLFQKKTAPRKITNFGCRVIKIFKKSVTKAQVNRYADNFICSVGKVIRNKRCFAIMIGVGVMFWILVMTRFFLIFRALGVIDVSIPMLMLTLTLSSFVGLIPLLPGGLGTVDFTYVAIFMLFGVAPEIAVGVVLIERLISYVMGIVVGAAALSYLGISAWKRD
jgi:hypothetical protein